jgi:hypothetical protein
LIIPPPDIATYSPQGNSKKESGKHIPVSVAVIYAHRGVMQTDYQVNLASVKLVATPRSPVLGLIWAKKSLYEATGVPEPFFLPAAT